MIGRIWRQQRLQQALATVDRQLFRHFSFLKRQCRYVVVTMRKSEAPSIHGSHG
jgi:hypothetical protein